MNRSVVFSGCSGGGKSSLLAEMARRGYRVIEEPGRRIVAEELRRNGSAVPWLDLHAFLQRAIATARDDLASIDPHADAWTFFDRGLVDAEVALAQLHGTPPAVGRAGNAMPYHRKVFLVPPWPEIYVRDSERRHDFAAAVKEYSALLAAYPSLGYEAIVLPKRSVAERADYVLDVLRSDR